MGDEESKPRLAPFSKPGAGEPAPQSVPHFFEQSEAAGRLMAGLPEEIIEEVAAIGPKGLEPPAGQARPKYEFITGTAGTGKTFMVKKLAEEDRGIELAATTGIAAVNLGEGITTINSMLRFFDTASLRDSWTMGQLGARLTRMWDAGTRRVIIDEVSMMDGDQLTVLVGALDELMDRERPLDIGLTLTGDFCQLPPVKAPFAFESPVWDRFADHVTRLTEIKRQAEKDFCEALQQARRGDLRCLPFFSSIMKQTTEKDFPGPTLLSKNAEVDRFNWLRHTELQGEILVWKNEKAGEQRGEWKLIPESLELKEGAQVMLLANQREMDDEGHPTGRYLYVNGDIGQVVGREGEAWAKVKLARNEEVVRVERVERENKAPLTAERRKALKEAGVELQPNQKWETIGRVLYMPMRLAYATTVHKSQGLSLSNVQINFSDHFWESPGMLYVALSRAREVKGLRLVGRPETFIKRLNTDPRVKGWL